MRALLGRMANLAREHPFDVAQVGLLVLFVVAATIAGFLFDDAAGFAALAVSSLVSCVVIGWGA